MEALIGKSIWFMCMLATMTLIIMSLDVVHGQGGGAPPPVPSAECKDTVNSLLSSCGDYVGNPSKALKPGVECCKTLNNTINTKPICICDVLDVMQSSTSGSYNMTRVYELPSLCSIPNPNLDDCINVTTRGPAPGPTPPSSEKLPPRPSAPPPSSTLSPPPTSEPPSGSTPAPAPKENGHSVALGVSSRVFAVCAIVAAIWNFF